MNSKPSFKEAMTRLGENDSADDHLCRTLGEFVCTVYGGGRTKDVNTLWFNKFTEKQNRENKYVDLSALQSCQVTLKLHILPANRVAYLMKRSSVAQAEEPPLSNCGWGHEGRIIWIAEAYPSAVEWLLVDSRNADESDEEDMNEYFGDNYMRGEHDQYSSNICGLEFTCTIFICVWHLRNIITSDLGQNTCLNFKVKIVKLKFKITKFTVR